MLASPQRILSPAGFTRLLGHCAGLHMLRLDSLPWLDVATLLAALPERSENARRLATIPGMVPGLNDRPKGCLFSPRCAYATEHSRNVQPQLRPWMDGRVRCHYPLGDPDRDAERARDGAGLTTEATR